MFMRGRHVHLYMTGFIEDDPSLSTTLFSFLLLTRGIGNILSTPISTVLQHTKAIDTHLRLRQPTSGFEVANGQFEAMIVYAGTCFAGAAVVAVIGWYFDRRTNSHRVAASMHPQSLG